MNESCHGTLPLTRLGFYEGLSGDNPTPASSGYCHTPNRREIQEEGFLKILSLSLLFPVQYLEQSIIRFTE